MSTFEREGWYRIEVPDGWILNQVEDPLAIHHPEGCGALQISTQSARPLKPGERMDPYLFLRAYLRQSGVDIEETDADRRSADGIDWATSEYQADSPDEGMLNWRVWFATNHDVLIFLTYACREEDRETERWLIDGMIKSLELL